MSDEDHNRGLEGTETQEIEQVQISTSQSQANSSHNEVALNIRDEKNGKFVVETKKIPETMKKNEKFKKYFRPEWAFGPIHCLDSSKQDVKDKLRKIFTPESDSEEEKMFNDFKTNMNGGKDKIFDIRDEELRSYFLDGCAILGFIHCYLNWELEAVGIGDTEAGDIERDLLLVENQIPFRVLEVLIDLVKNKEKKSMPKDSLVAFIYSVCGGTFPGHSSEDLYEYLENYCFPPETNKNQKPVHLLDVYREALLFKPPYSFDLSRCLLSVIRGASWILCPCFCLPFSYILERFKTQPHYYNTISLFRRVKEAFFSVQELKAAGIEFKPSHSLKTVSFRSLFFFRPQLMLPTLIVDNSTAYKLVNLVAYENCLSNDHPNAKPWVTSYVNLLDSLVDNEQDIKDLRAAGILRNTLSTDTLAAELINEVGTGCIAPTEDAYMDVKKKVEKFYRITCAIWMAQFCSTHFSSPWTITALFAATVVLVLTVIQTWYGVNPKE